MKLRSAIAFMALLLLASVVWAADDQATVNDNKIFTLALEQFHKDGGYTVVNPKTGFSYSFTRDAKELEQVKQRITEFFKSDGARIAKLVDQLFERNKAPAPLMLRSFPENGYVIDYDGKYAKYFDKKDGRGWERWRNENPKAHGSTSISLPAHDPETGLLLIEIGTQWNGLAGRGFLILYKYENGEIKEIKRMETWVS